MKRREFVERLGTGAVGIAASVAAGANGEAATRRQMREHQHDPVTGPLASATVSFGQWGTDPPLDRYPNSSPRSRNQHAMIPYEATIKAGGCVNIMIAGFHQVLVYAPGTTLESIDSTLLVPAVPRVSPPLIDDPNNRAYRGPEPRLLPEDRIEVIGLAHPGSYLVVCGVLPHFVDRMHGFIKVL